jgi:hypothetical protein
MRGRQSYQSMHDRRVGHGWSAARAPAKCDSNVPAADARGMRPDDAPGPHTRPPRDAHVLCACRPARRRGQGGIAARLSAPVDEGVSAKFSPPAISRRRIRKRPRRARARRATLRHFAARSPLHMYGACRWTDGGGGAARWAYPVAATPRGVSCGTSARVHGCAYMWQRLRRMRGPGRHAPAPASRGSGRRTCCRDRQITKRLARVST